MKFTKIFFLLATSIFFGLNAIAQSTSLDTSKIGDNPTAGHYINTRGFSMYYETYGMGHPLLLIHGNGGSISNFMYQIPYFAGSYKVIAADSRAQGKSVDTGDSLSYEMMADDLNALLDSLHQDSCYVIGWNDGGTEGLLLAMRHPDKVKKLAVAGAKLWSDTSAVDPSAYNWAMNYIASFANMKQTPAIRNNKKVAQLMAYEPHILPAQLQNVRCPTLVIGGDHDIILPKHTMLIAESLPKSYLWILPGSGNAILIDNTSLFNSVVNNFFASPYKKITGLDRFN